MSRKNNRILPSNVKQNHRQEMTNAARRFKEEQKVIQLFRPYERPGRLVATYDWKEGA